MTTIVEFFSGQTVFVTGGSGFMGKILLEKILRSCPDVGNVYVLIRSKKGRSPHERLLDITNNVCFDLLKRERPENLKKLIPIAGDSLELGLGLSEHDRQILEENVSIVFHGAATVRFDDTLKYATLMNTRGTREVMLLARNMKNLKVLLHISTSYANCDKNFIEEIIYPPPADWREIISIAENVDERVLDVLAPKLLGKLPNTYVYTKSLSEHVVKDLGKGIPVVIFRPSIVISSLDEPLVGWADNYNGPIGIALGSGKGVIRVVLGDPKIVLDHIPVDVATKLMCIAVWRKGTAVDSEEISIYNASSGETKVITMGDMLNVGQVIANKYPLDKIMWKPYLYATKYKPVYYFRMILVHLIPALIVDALLKLKGEKPMLLKLQRRVHVAQMALYYFTTTLFKISNERCLTLREGLHPSDVAPFGLDNIENMPLEEFFLRGVRGGRMYLLKEPVTEPTPAMIAHANRMWWLDAVLRGVRFALAGWLVYYSGVLQSFIHYISTKAMYHT